MTTRNNNPAQHAAERELIITRFFDAPRELVCGYGRVLSTWCTGGGPKTLPHPPAASIYESAARTSTACGRRRVRTSGTEASFTKSLSIPA